VPDTYFGM